MPSAYEGTDIISCLRSKYIIRQSRISYRVSDISLKNITFYDRIPMKEGVFMRLYRPVGQAELNLIISADYNSYPPRLPEQPIFYPVLNERYAREIAERWNKKSADSGYAGYVTTFEIDDDYISKFDIQTVGANYHQEFWVPAEELEEFNRNIIGKIEVI